MLLLVLWVGVGVVLVSTVEAAESIRYLDFQLLPLA
jgi:hypothetical protein